MSVIRALYAGLSVFYVLFLVTIYKWDVSERIGVDRPPTSASVTIREQLSSTNEFVTSKLSINYTLMNEIAALLEVSSTKRTPFEDRDHCDMNRPSNYSGLIVVDWTYKSDSFSFINYKSFESLLQVYPCSEVHVHLIAPVTANYYKIGDFLSKHQLQKYVKMGYNIKIKVLSESLKKSIKAVDSPSAVTSPLGSDYWDAEMDKCCLHRRAADIARKRPLVPLHLYFYRRLLSLYENGGIYSDFAWYHIRALDVASSLGSHLSSQSSYSLPIEDDNSFKGVEQAVPEQMKSFAGVEFKGGPAGSDVHGVIVQLHCRDASSEDGEGEHCSSSSLMAFSRHSVILRCMLLQYNSTTSNLLQCLLLQPDNNSMNSSVSTLSVAHEVKCITESLRQCFSSNHLSNDFFRLHPSAPTSTGIRTDIDERVAVGPNRTNEGDLRREELVFGCNKEFLLSDAIVEFMHDDHHLASEQVELSSVTNMGNICAGTSSSATSTTSSMYDDLLWSSSGAPSSELYYCSCNTTMCAEYKYLHSTMTAEQSVRARSELYSAIWLGSKAMDGSWSTPDSDSLLFYYLNSSVPLVSRVPESNSLHRRFSSALKRKGQLASSASSCLGTGQNCRRPELEAVVQQYLHHVKRSQIKVLGRTKRAEYEYYRFANQYSRVVTYNELYHSMDKDNTASLFDSSPSCRNYQVDNRSMPSRVRQASLSCGPSFVLPGFMKAGTTFLFGVLTRHPHILNALRGTGFKETGCYLPSSRRENYMDCFPFVEPSDQMLFGDGTVWYMFRRDVQELLLADNPSIKLIVCIRDPVERTVSHHRFYYRQLAYKKGTVQDINEILGIVFDRSEGNIMDWHDLAWEIVREQDATNRILLIHSLQSSIFAGLKPKKQKRYKVYGQMIVHSLYFPAIHHWYSKIKADNLLVVPVDTLDTRQVAVDLKMEFIRNFTGTDEHPRRLDTFQSEDNDSNEHKAARSADKVIDNLYLLHQYNRIFR